MHMEVSNPKFYNNPTSEENRPIIYVVTKLSVVTCQYYKIS